jgi:hypothetical protein
LLTRELLMKGISFALFLATSFLVLLPRHAAAVQVTLILRNMTTNDFVEWKVTSKSRCTRSTGKLRRDTESFEQSWEVGHPGHDIRFWWSHLSGDADATVLVDNVVVFKGRCLHGGTGKVRMIDTCPYPLVYKTGGSGPYLLDQLESDTTDILFATSMLPERFYNR